jgi:hypothetical protein
MAILSPTAQTQVEQALVSDGLLTALELDDYKKKAEAAKQPLLGLLVQEGKITDEQLTKALADASNLPYVNLTNAQVSKNVLGGKSDTSAQAVPPDVDNARLALDALPTIYDYPATIASLTKILTDDGIGSPSITGTDQSTTIKDDPTSDPSPIKITLGISGTGNYSSVRNVLRDLERSIRPFDVTSLSLSGTENNLTLNASVDTYFQPAKVLGITPKEVR